MSLTCTYTPRRRVMLSSIIHLCSLSCPRRSCRPCLPDLSLHSLFLAPVFLFSSPSDCCPFLLQVEQLPLAASNTTGPTHRPAQAAAPQGSRRSSTLAVLEILCGYKGHCTIGLCGTAHGPVLNDAPSSWPFNPPRGQCLSCYNAARPVAGKTLLVCFFYSSLAHTCSACI